MKQLALHILDIAQNGIAAGASSMEIIIDETIGDGRMVVELFDNGRGIPAEMLELVTDPYFTSRTTRKVGLGLPLFKQQAEQTGGSLSIWSEPGTGTRVVATFALTHPDTPPAGDLTGVIILLVCANPTMDFLYIHRTKKGAYRFDTREIRTVLEGVPIDHPDVRGFLKEMLSGNLEEIEAGQSAHINTQKPETHDNR
jgi:anti-sigma regulatory factor (Ser/Thr protein kinase)